MTWTTVSVYPQHLAGDTSPGTPKTGEMCRQEPPKRQIQDLTPGVTQPTTFSPTQFEGDWTEGAELEMREEDVQCYGVQCYGLPKSSSAFFFPHLLTDGKQGRDPLFCLACVCRFAVAVKLYHNPGVFSPLRFSITSCWASWGTPLWGLAACWG